MTAAVVRLCFRVWPYDRRESSTPYEGRTEIYLCGIHQATVNLAVILTDARKASMSRQLAQEGITSPDWESVEAFWE